MSEDQHQNYPTENSSLSQSSKFILLLIVGMLIAWAVYLAVGSYLSIGTNESRADNKLDPVYDWRKPLLVIGCMGAFLGTWALAMVARAKRVAKEKLAQKLAAQEQEQPTENENN